MANIPWSTPVDLSFYKCPTVDVARRLLGLYVVRSLSGSTLAGRIVETEAYLADDPASHSFIGKTARNATMFADGGCAYVYLSYGVHQMLNVVTGPEGVGEAVLIRALEPVWGVDEMQNRRGRAGLDELCSGPGKLCQALAIDRTLDGVRFDQSPLSICEPIERPKLRIVTTTRIGITKAVDRPWRFYIAGNEHVSRR